MTHGRIRGDNTIPTAVRLGDWETPATINDTWGFKKADTNWKTADELVFHLVDIVSKGGNYLINVGPDAMGVIPGPSQRALRKVGKWMEVNAESIRGADPTPFGAEFGSKAWRCTAKPWMLYIHIFEWPGAALKLSAMPAMVDDACLLADSQQTSLPISQEGGELTVGLPDRPANRIPTVVRLKLRQP